MRLVLSKASPWNAQYCTPDGQVLYETEAPLTIGIRPITITRYAPPAYSVRVPDAAFGDSKVDLKERNSEETDDSHDNLVLASARREPLAVVDWSVLSPSRIRYQGQDWSVSDFFRKQGFSWFGRNRVFTGPDGREYVWKMGPRTPTLYLKETNVVVAEFHRKCFGYVFSKSEKSSLEIMPQGEHMVDLILVTFIYIEKLRKERERRSRNGGGGS